MTVANAHNVDLTHAVIFFVANAIVVKVAVRAVVQAVHDAVVVGVVVAIQFWILAVVADAVVVRITGHTSAVANAECVVLTHAVVHVVRNAIVVGVSGTIAIHAQGVKLTTVAVAMPADVEHPQS